MKSQFKVTLVNRLDGREITKPFMGYDADEVWEAFTRMALTTWTVKAVSLA